MNSQQSIEHAYRTCRDIARHYENFPVGSRLVPRRLRKHVAAIYAFARTADDFADEAAYEGIRLEKLGEWKEQLCLCYEGKPTNEIFLALSDTVKKFHIPPGPFEKLLDAFTQDVTTNRYESFEDVLNYCERSANPVGHLVLYLFGYEDRERQQYSDAICTALQLTNFWQDVLVDREKNRIYIPIEDMKRFGVSEDDLFEERKQDEWGQLQRYEIERTEELFREGEKLLPLVNRRLRLELRAIVTGGKIILRKITRQGCNIFAPRVSLDGKDKLHLVKRILFYK